MKGVVFTEFLEMVEDKFGYETADEIVLRSHLASGGVYSAVGTYPHQEMIQLVSQLSQKTGLEVPSLLKTYGQHLFGVFAKNYFHFFEGATSAFDFLSTIENYIHVEVKKLYPDAELPQFAIRQPSPGTLIMEYRSERGLADLAEGLIDSAISHFEEKISLQRENLAADMSYCRFTLTHL